MGVLTPASSRPVTSILSFFTLFKGFLLLVSVAASVGPDYDTSTSLFFRGHTSSTDPPSASSVAHRLTRWDAIYFTAASRPEGLIYEQQWAFGPAGLPALVSFLTRLCEHGPLASVPALQPWLAIVVAHVSHLVTSLALYYLTLRLSRDARLSLVSALLHIVSPAGLFLSAPYAESPFACLTLLGHLLALASFDTSLRGDLSLIGAGMIYGISTLYRSNGLISGMLFAVEAVAALSGFIRSRSFSDVQRLSAAVVGGICVAAGLVIPQYFAWKVYCGTEALRPWCSKLIPSIYTFVQEAYWNVGFLRYWTLDQLPLFLLASPVLYLLIRSGTETIRTPAATVFLRDARLETFVRVLAACQTALALMAITNYHVQIISRISSAYPVWYWWVAGCLMKSESKAMGRGITTFMVMYAGIQGGLFASFLPPA